MRETETSAPSLGEQEIVTLIARVWLTEHGTSEADAADLADPGEFPHVAPEDWAACTEIAKHIIVRHSTAMAEAVASARAEGWQPIETAPKDGTRIDLWDGSSRRVNCHWNGDNWVQFVEMRQGVPRFVSGFTPTYWRLPPAPPTLIPGGSSDV